MMDMLPKETEFFLNLQKRSPSLRKFYKYGSNQMTLGGRGYCSHYVKDVEF
jgi:hypothetical protein